MISEKYSNTLLVGFATMIVVQVALFFWIVPQADPWRAELGRWLYSERAAGWAQAVAAFIAIGAGAAGIAWQVRRQEVERRETALHTAFAVAAQALPALKEIVAQTERIDTHSAHLVTTVKYSDRFPKLLPERWDAILSALNQSVIISLIPIAPALIRELATAIGDLQAVGLEVTEFHQGSAGWREFDQNIREGHLIRVAGRFNQSHERLARGIKELETRVAAVTHQLD